MTHGMNNFMSVEYSVMNIIFRFSCTSVHARSDSKERCENPSPRSTKICRVSETLPKCKYKKYVSSRQQNKPRKTDLSKYQRKIQMSFLSGYVFIYSFLSIMCSC